MSSFFSLYSNNQESGVYYTFKIPVELIEAYDGSNEIYLADGFNLKNYLVEICKDEEVVKKHKQKRLLDLKEQKEAIEEEIKNLSK